MNKFVKALIWIVVIFAVAFVGGAFWHGQGEFVVDGLFSGYEVWVIFFVGLGIVSIPKLKHIFDLGSGGGRDKDAGVGKTKDGQKISQYYDARFITENELRHEPRFRYNTWNSLKNEKKDGVVIRSLYNHGTLDINFTKSIHTMIIGTTGSGKTTLYIEPTIRIFSHMGAKPCMVITDPKGELYNNHSIQLKEEGYQVMVLDLRTPYQSTRWNPLSNSYDKYQRAHNLEKEVKPHRGVNPKDLNLKVIAKEYENEWYEFEGIAYPNQQVLKDELAAKKQILLAEAENELREIVATIVTIESKNDATWENGARDFLFGLTLAMLEDSLEPEKTGMTRDKFNFYNLTKMALFKDPDPDNPFGTLREYCNGRDKLSKVPSLTGVVVNNAPNTSKSYMGVLQPKLSVFQDIGICYATAESEMSFDDFTDQPTVLFIKVPDEQESRHCIATMCISQLYKKLIETAGKRTNLSLARPVHFLLDEFANLPKIEKMDSLITVGRSRQIYFHLVVQSYSQLDNKYGKEAADIIRGNCNIQIYIGTDDQKTKEDFSKLCGDVSLQMENTSYNKNEKKDDGSSKTTSTQMVTRALIIPYELGQLPKNTVIVKIFQENPIKTIFTPWYQVPIFDKRKAQAQYVPSKPLDEQRIYFDMKERNKKVNKRNRPSFDDFDF